MVNLAQLEIFAAGLYTFRVFDIWKPFPARQAESLPAAWESWPMTGSREFTRRWDSGSPGRSAFKSYRTQGFVGRGFSRDIQESDKLGL